MNKPELIAYIADVNGCTKVEAKRIIEYFSRGVFQALADGEEVNISGFGAFRFVDRRAKKYCHPITGELLEMPPSRKVKFVPSSDLAKRVK